MSGAGKWIKKHPAEAAGALAILGTGGLGMAGIGPMAGLLGSGAAAGAATGAELGIAGAAGLGGTAASSFGAAPGLSASLLAAQPAVPTMAGIAAGTPTASGGLLSGLGGLASNKPEPYLMAAQMLNEPSPQAPPMQAPQRPQVAMPKLPPLYQDDTEERRKQYEQWLMMQRGGMYG